MPNSRFSSSDIDPWTYGDLPIEIHPILRSRHWLRISETDALWSNIELALRLASHFLRQGGVLLWWTHMLLGEIRTKPMTHSRYLAESPCSWAYSYIRWVEVFLQTAVPGRVNFAFIKLEGDDEHADGMTWEHRRYPEMVPGHTCLDHSRAQFPSNAPISIGLNYKFAEYFQSGDATHRVKTSWYLALVILHELAHAVWMIRDQNERSITSGTASECLDTSEPLFQMIDDEGELGWSLENYLFGMQFDGHLDGELGAGDLTAVINNLSDVQYSVSTDFVEQYFWQATWERLALGIERGKLCWWSDKAWALCRSVDHHTHHMHLLPFQIAILIDEKGIYINHQNMLVFTGRGRLIMPDGRIHTNCASINDSSFLRQWAAYAVSVPNKPVHPEQVIMKYVIYPTGWKVYYEERFRIYGACSDQRGVGIHVLGEEKGWGIRWVECEFSIV